jgi:hypothetical protein
MKQKGMMDILLDRLFSKEPEKNENDKSDVKEEVDKEALRRVRQKIQDKEKREQQELDDALGRARRDKRKGQDEEKRQKENEAFVQTITAPTKRLAWECVDGKASHLRGLLNKVPVFEIKIGVMTYHLRFLEGEKKPDLLERAKAAKTQGSFTSVDILGLKKKAEKVLAQIESFEKRNNSQRPNV